MGNMEVDESKLVFAQSPAEAVDGAHAIVVLTEWDEFKTYPYQDFYAKMLKPAFLFDGRGILNHKALEDIGLKCMLSARVAVRMVACECWGRLLLSAEAQESLFYRRQLVVSWRHFWCRR